MASRAEPRVGCGAAIVRDGAILLVLRKRAPEAGCWGLPGGKVDWMETIADTVDREVAEEVDLTITAKSLLCVVDQIQPEEDQHWIAPVFRVEAFDGEPRLLEPEALGGVEWFSLTALPEKLTITARAAIAAL